MAEELETVVFGLQEGEAGNRGIFGTGWAFHSLDCGRKDPVVILFWTVMLIWVLLLPDAVFP